MPRCFEIEQRLKQVLDNPIFHDDQRAYDALARAVYDAAVQSGAAKCR